MPASQFEYSIDNFSFVLFIAISGNLRREVEIDLLYQEYDLSHTTMLFSNTVC